MSDYSPRIVDHFTNPRNIGEMENPDVKAYIGNPVCGDQIHLFARIQDGRISECTFLGYGCAASIATGSILTEEIKHRLIDELENINESQIVEMVGGLTPVQQHCATLARDVLNQLVHNHRTGSSQGSQGSGPACC